MINKIASIKKTKKPVCSFKHSMGLAVFMALSSLCFSQGRVVMNNDGYIVITNSAYLVIDNNASTGITQTGTGGRIISEAETNIVRWDVSNATGTYTVPFYENGEALEIPVTAIITTGGTAGATNHIDFSTYDGSTWDNNTYRPTGVTNMGNATIPAANNSAQVTDRFWILDANHATKPAVTLSFTFIDAENAAPNTLAEGNLKAQRWNTTVGDWDGFIYPPTGSVNTATNIVSAVVAPAADFFRSWTLVDFNTPLPIELLSNEVNCNDENVVIKWTTASETNNDFFTIEKSIDGINFISIGTIAGAGNSTSILNYTFIDYNANSGISYYRLKQTDYNGNSETFSVLTSQNCNATSLNINAFNDQTGNISIVIDTDVNSDYIAVLYDALGKKIGSKELKTLEGNNTFKLNISSLNSGIYFISIESENEKITKKIFVFW